MENMEKSDVYFTDMRTRVGLSFFTKLEKMMKKTGYSRFINKAEEVIAVKLHFGERGNTSHISPQYVKCFVKDIKKRGKKLFLTDSSSVYAGSRSDAVSHLETAYLNGFTYSSVGAPIVIADGLRGNEVLTTEVNLDFFKSVDLAKTIFEAERMLCITHFKCHELTGFGGAIKNIGMGLAAKSGKLAMHSTECPVIKKTCKGCRLCIKYCSADAIKINNDGLACIDESACIGCGQCIISCPSKCVQLRWNESADNIQKKIAEYVYGALVTEKLESYFVNFVTNVTPDCDCFTFSDSPIVPDIGVLFSKDPVAIDQASADMVIAAEGLPGTALSQDKLGAGEDKFRGVHPHINWETQLEHAEKLGIGSRKYNLVTLKL